MSALSSRAAKAAAAAHARELSAFIDQIAAPFIKATYRIESPDHVTDLVEAAVAKDPALLHTFRRLQAQPKADFAGLIGLLRSTLADLSRSDPEAFLQTPSADSFARTYVAWLFGLPWGACDAGQRSQAMGEAHRDGADNRRRLFSQMVRELTQRGQGHLVDKTPYKIGAALLGHKDPREEPARAGRTLPGVATVSASRSAFPDGRQGQIAGGPRPKPRTVQLFDPAGVLRDVNAEAAPDFIRLKGWRPPVAVPAPPPAPAANAADENDNHNDAPAPVAPRSPAQAQTISTLAQLREEATALGVDVSPNFGIARLRAEIAAATPPAPSPETTDTTDTKETTS